MRSYSAFSAFKRGFASSNFCWSMENSGSVGKPTEFERIIVDTTVQEKAIAYPVESRLLEIALLRPTEN